MAYQTYHYSVVSRCSFCHTAFLHITCAVWSSSFYALCTISILSIVPLLCYSAAAISSFFTPKSHFFTNNNHNNLQHQQQSHLFSVRCIYRFCAPCACNVLHSSACSNRANLLHLSSALRDLHRNSSASLAVFPSVF
jgi:hypothetical protein